MFRGNGALHTPLANSKDEWQIHVRIRLVESYYIYLDF